MDYKPILFNTEMVRAILDGRKTQTRRLIRCNSFDVYKMSCFRGLWHESYDPQNPPPFLVEVYARSWKKTPCNTGDILWVRETWDDIPVSPGGHMRFGGMYYYKADGDIRPDGWRGNWKPSIHMPKKAARIFLKVQNVHVERLQEITVLDAINEGCGGEICDHVNADSTHGCTDCYNTGWLMSPDAEFAELWDTTVKPSDRLEYGWDANPWVWMIEFERCERPEGWCGQ